MLQFFKTLRGTFRIQGNDDSIIKLFRYLFYPGFLAIIRQALTITKINQGIFYCPSGINQEAFNGSFVLVPDSLHKLFFLPPGHIKRYTILHYYLSAFSFYIFFNCISVNNMRMMYTDKNSRR